VNRIAKVLTRVTVVAVIGVVTALAQAQAPATGPQWKDTAEYDLFQQIQKATAPAARLPLLDSWKEKYPDSAFKMQRLILYLTTYQQVGQTPKAVESAKEILTIDAKEPNALFFLTRYGQILPATPDSLATGEKAAQGLLGMDKPAGVDDAQWGAMKTQFATTAHTTLGFIAHQKKDYDAEEQEYKKVLEIDPTQAAASYALGTAIIAQKKPDRYSEALFEIARAAALTGPNALQPAMQKPVEAFLVKSYIAYHGSEEGLKELRQLAVGPKPLPDSGFKIKDKNEIEEENKAKLAAADPQLAFWKTLKDGLLAPNGEQYFESSVKDAALPPENIKKLKGKIVSIKPAVRPKEIVLSMDEENKPQVTLKLENALPGKADPGAEIQFEGLAQSFTKEPFMLTFAVEDNKKITGWPAQAAPAPARRPTATKKGAAKK